MNAMSELYAMQVQSAHSAQNAQNALGAYVSVPGVSPQATKLVIYGALGLVAVAVVFYLLNKK